MTKVIYFILRRFLVTALLLGALPPVLLGGCGVVGDAEIISPFTGPESGPRSFEAIRAEMAAQSDSLRKLYIQAQGLYPYLINRYRVRLRIEDDGEVSNVEMLDRLYVLKDFENQFIERLYQFRFTPYDGPAVEIIYTFSFHPQTGVTSRPAKNAKEDVDFESFPQAEKVPAKPAAEKQPEMSDAPEAAAPASAPAEDKAVGEMRETMQEIEEEAEGAKIADEAGKQPEPEIDAPVVEEAESEPAKSESAPEPVKESPSAEAAPAPEESAPASEAEAPPQESPESSAEESATTAETAPAEATEAAPAEAPSEDVQEQPEQKSDPLDPRQWLGDQPEEQDLPN